jgi:hypothetical protein
MRGKHATAPYGAGVPRYFKRCLLYFAARPWANCYSYLRASAITKTQLRNKVTPSARQLVKYGKYMARHTIEVILVFIHTQT